MLWLLACPTGPFFHKKDPNGSLMTESQTDRSHATLQQARHAHRVWWAYRVVTKQTESVTQYFSATRLSHLLSHDEFDTPATMNLRTAVINLSFYTDATAIHPNDNSGCVIRRNENGSFSVQVNWDRPSRVYPILAVNYRTNNRDHQEFVVDMRKELHIIHDHITSVQNLLTAFICGVEMVDYDYPIDKHEFRYDDILCVKKTVLENHWQTKMTQYRGLWRPLTTLFSLWMIRCQISNAIQTTLLWRSGPPPWVPSWPKKTLTTSANPSIPYRQGKLLHAWYLQQYLSSLTQ